MIRTRLWFCVLVCSFGLTAPGRADLFVAGLSNAIYRYDENTGAFLNSFGTGTGGIFNAPVCSAHPYLTDFVS